MVEKIFPANVDSLSPALEFVCGLLEDAEASMKATMQIEVAFEEMFVNVARYSYPDSEGTVKISVEIEDRTAIITLTDSGIPFNPLEKEDPDVTASAEERGIGGLGIFMVKKTMDDVRYRYENSQNILSLYKQI